MDLALIWAFLIAFAVLAYVVLDGFDLGIGILFPWFRPAHERDLLSASIAPVWDGNETWLILGGGGVMAAFPLAYAILMPAFYAPLIVMLLGLIFRGVAFEFRHRSQRWQTWWDLGFWLGSTAAAFCQGLALGTWIQGIEVAERSYGGGWFDWLTPFSVAIGAALVCGYALLGCGWLIMKTTGPVQERAFRLAKPFFALLVAGIVGVSIWSPFHHAAIAERWFSWPNPALLSPVPLLVAALAWRAWRGLARREERSPFLCALGLFVLSFAGLGISFYPVIVPFELTIHDAAAPDSSLVFLLVGAGILLPIILAYTGYAYWVFRGKTDVTEGYH
ncbi:MAG: cytochrome d ubiquinol oxidase subunit II [Alphaproteobacteria bacterium]